MLLHEPALAVAMYRSSLSSHRKTKSDCQIQAQKQNLDVRLEYVQAEMNNLKIITTLASESST